MRNLNLPLLIEALKASDIDLNDITPFIEHGINSELVVYETNRILGNDTTAHVNRIVQAKAFLTLIRAYRHT